ncbi:MAG: sugar phosphate isomerase/epimerase family protein [Limisphaerales bacterium]
MRSASRVRAGCVILTIVAGLQAPPARAAQEPGATALNPTNSHRVYSHLLDPREHPDYDRRAVKPPTWETFKNRTQFTCLRGFGMSDDRLVGFVEEMEKFTRTYELGDVIWPSYSTLFAKNLGDLADEIHRRDLYLFDLWGYVPGSGPGGYWQQFTPPAGALATLETKLGDRWLGTDIGEQDGRYLGGYANQMTPASASRFDQYLNFQRHFERMDDDLGHKHAALVSLNFGHYFLKEGTYTLLGAETAQALPNSQVYYAFIRGAGRQYGVPWFGNASVFNRWGYKTYGSAGGTGGETHGPTKGTSLSLLKRLLYSHILYNCVAVGFENGWFEGDKLSPIGRIQQSAQHWVKENGQPGVMHTPVALLLDFYAGWSFPRHLYSGEVYRVWGNRPYEAGDFLTDAVLDLVYPGYQNSSYFHDESGFIAPTPFGDIADCLLSDAPLWALDRYAAVIVAGELAGGREVRDKLQAYAERGGHLVMTAGNLAKLPGGIAGCTNVSGILTIACGRGRVTVFASPFGVEPDPAANEPLHSETDKPLPKPFALAPDVRLGLEAILRSQQLFAVHGEGLSLITCRRRAGEFTIGMANNTWHEQPFRLESLCGSIESLRELPLDRSEAGATGQTPEGVDASNLGNNTASTIAGGDFRIFAVRLREAGVEEIQHEAPPPRPRGRILTLRHATSIKQEILARPSFFEHFDGVCVDWTYLHEREKAALQRESGWLKRQGARIVAHLSSGVNLYPTLRLVDNLPADYTASMEAVNDVLAKMEILGARDLVLSLHRDPENNFTEDQTRAAFTATLKTLAGEAAKRGVTLQLLVGSGKPPRNVAEGLEWLDRVKAPNLRLVLSTASLGHQPPTSEAVAPFKDKLGLWLVAAARRDAAGKVWDTHAPVHLQRSPEDLAKWLALSPGTPTILDGLLANQDEEYLETVALNQALAQSAPAAAH